MVSNISPSSAGVAGAAPLAPDARFARTQTGADAAAEDRLADRVEISATTLAAARDSVGDALSQLRQTLALGHDAQATLLKVLELARGGGDQAELSSVLSGYAERAEAAIAAGARLAAGESVAVQAEPGAAPVVVAGADLRLGSEAGVMSFGPEQQLDRANLERLTQRALEGLQSEVGRLLESARALEAHQGFLGAAAEAGARGDFDADTARLIALQVRQGLEAAGGASIANVEPQAVLSLFRA